MSPKDKLRKKFVFLRRKKYFFVDKDFFKPLIKKSLLKKKMNISLYYPSNFELDTYHLFSILKKRNFSTIITPVNSHGN